MIILNQNILRSIFFGFLGCLVLVNKTNTYSHDWMSVEAVAEEYPYVVGLLNNHKQYVCTGISINNWTVLTSGDCASPQPSFIATASAVLIELQGNSIIKVASTVRHSDYTFNLKPEVPENTQVHSNIGLVFAEKPVLDSVIDVTEFGNYFASELRNRRLTVVGYGELYSTNSTKAVLRKQDYHQTPCTNPKWYYCVCGIEYASYIEHRPFGRGGPVFVGSKLAGVAAAPCGVLELPGVAVRYNIFTVVGPYLPWIEKNTVREEPHTFKMVKAPIQAISRSHVHKVSIKTNIVLFFIRILIKYYL